jgi:hypothetical protein
MILIGLFRIHFENHIIADFNMYPKGKRGGHAPATAIVIKIQLSPDIEIDGCRGIIAVLMLGPIAVSGSPRRRPFFDLLIRRRGRRGGVERSPVH